MRILIGYHVVFAFGLCTRLTGQPLPIEAVADVSERLQREGKPGEAEKVLLSVIAEKSSLRPHELAYLYNNLGSIYQDQHRYVLAESSYRRSIAQWEASSAPIAQAALAQTLNNLASLLWETGKLREAEGVLVRGVAIQIGKFGRQHQGTTRMLVNLARLHLRQQRWTEAEKELKAALAAIDESGSDQPETGVTAQKLGLIYTRFGRIAEADTLFKRAQSAWEARLAAGELTAAQIADLGLTYYYTGKHRTAEVMFKRSLAETEENFGPLHPNTAHVLSAYAAFLSVTDRKAQARSLEKRAKLIRTGDIELRLANETIRLADLRSTKRK